MSERACLAAMTLESCKAGVNGSRPIVTTVLMLMQGKFIVSELGQLVGEQVLNF